MDFTQLLQAPGHLQITAGFVAALALSFIFLFVFPALRHWPRLRKIYRTLDQLPVTSSIEELKRCFDIDQRLAHLWKEYQDSLHRQEELRGGRNVLVAVRATVPAETYFSTQVVVDSRLKTEFFKHLPGVFTGLGIIGTFSGLIQGLGQFQVSENAEAVRTGLESLMHSVGEAFLISAAAITMAMIVTVVEKFLLSNLYHHTEEIAHAIDARFDAGAGEEYLSRLVKASEDSASQSKILKDALVKDLGELLREITQAQIASAVQCHQQLVQRIDESSRHQSDVIARSIHDSLQAPLKEIASTVKAASGDQSAAAVQMLNDVMVSFSQRLNDLFGSQISGINELNRQSSQGMQDAVVALNTLVSRMESTAKRSTEEMAAEMSAAIRGMEEHQSNINAQNLSYMAEMRELIHQSQADTQGHLQESLSAIGRQMATVLDSLGESQSRVLEQNQQREQLMSDRAEGMISSMTSTVESAAREMTAATQTMSHSVAVLSGSTSSSIDKMNVGADRMASAAGTFAQAGDRVNAALAQAATISAKLTEVAGTLGSGATALQDVVRDYRAQRDAIVQLLSEVRATVEISRREASLAGDVLRHIEASTEKLGSAQKAADEYLDGVSDVLVGSSEAFRESVVSTLEKVNFEFHRKLSDAVGLLSATIGELEVTLGTSTPKR